GESAVRALLLHHLEHTLSAGGGDRYDHDTADSELLQERRRNMIDATGDDNLVEWGNLLPAVIAVGALGGDRLILGVAARDQSLINAAGALRQRLDNLDGEYLVGEVGQIRGLVSRPGSDLQDLIAQLNVQGGGHAADNVRSGNRDAVTDVEISVIV